MTYKLVISAIIASSLSALPAMAKTTVTKGNGTVRIANEHVAMEFADNGSFDIVSMKFAGTEMAKPGDNMEPDISWRTGRNADHRAPLCRLPRLEGGRLRHVESYCILVAHTPQIRRQQLPRGDACVARRQCRPSALESVS